MKKKSKLCTICNDLFHKGLRSSDSQWRKRKFCSHKCYWESLKNINPEQFIDNQSNLRNKIYNKEQLKGLTLGRGWNKGIQTPIEIREKLKGPRPSIRGENNYNWKGGTYGTERSREMQRSEYSLWRSSVFERDGYTCQICKKVGGRLSADHIKPWSLFPELRLAIDNGRTLCVECHKMTDTYGGKIFTIRKNLANNIMKYK